MKREKIKITNFSLNYRGIFYLKFQLNGKIKQRPIFLEPSDLLKIIKNEEQANKTSQEITDKMMNNYVEINHSTIILEATIEDDQITGFLTEELAEDLMDKGYYLLWCEVE